MENSLCVDKTNCDFACFFLSVSCMRLEPIILRHGYSQLASVWPDGLLIFSNLAIYNTKNVPNSIKIQKVGSKFCTIPNNPKNGQRFLKFRQSSNFFAKSGHTGRHCKREKRQVRPLREIRLPLLRSLTDPSKFYFTIVHYTETSYVWDATH